MNDKNAQEIENDSIRQSHQEIKQLSLRMDEQTRYFEAILSSISDFAYTFDRDGRFVFVNQALLDLWGLKLEQAIGKNFFDLEYPDDLAGRLQRQIQQVYDTRERVTDETFYVSPTGVSGYYEYIFSPFFGADGAVELVVGTTRNITERKESEGEIKELGKRNRDILESITDAFFALDREWRFTYLNPQAEIVLDREPGDALGKNIWEEYPGLQGSEFEKAYRAAMDEHISSTVTAYYPDHGRWYEVHAFPASNGITVYFRNITDRVQSEDNLRRIQRETERQRRFYDTILSSSPDLVYVFDLDHRFTYANEVLLQMWGKTWDEAIGKTCLELGYEPWHAEMHDREIEQVKATKQPIRGEVPFAGTFGWRMYDYIFVPIFGANGEVEAVAGTTRDVTERKQIENRNRFVIELDEAVRPLETPEEVTRTLARLLGEYLGADRCAYAEVEADENHFYIPGDYTRGAMHSIVGRYAMSDFGTEVLRLMRENKTYVVHDVDNDAQVTQIDLAAYRQTAIQAVICVPLHKNGRFAACMAVHQKEPREWSAEEVELVSFVANRFWESIERARIIKSLNESFTREHEARQSAETANRVKDEFLATLSHELRTPLNAILGWSTMLRGGKLTEKEAARALETVERSARAQSQLIEDLLDISRIITGNLRLEVKAIDPVKVIEAAVEAVRPAADARRITLEISHDSQIGTISGDAGRLQQVVWNLVSNAVKFTAPAGRVRVRLEKVESHVEIAVSDTGKGIAPEFLPFIFDRFRQADQTTTRRQGGLGLGLSIVRQLVEMHGGTIQAESAGEGKGAEFIVKLPIASVFSDGVEQDPPRGQRSKVEGIQIHDAQVLKDLRVLVVDDELDSRSLLGIVLEQSGAKASLAGSAAEALESFEGAGFDLLISDIGMPGEDGYELIGKIRRIPAKKGGRIPAIALTAYARVEDRVRALNAGFQAHIAKPVEPVELVAVVASLAKGLRKK